MHVTYKPEDGDQVEWEFVPGRVRSSEMENMEGQFGGPWDELILGVQSGSVRARRVMLWHLIRRDHPTLRFADVPDFFADELLVQFSSKELGPMRDRILKAHMPADKREQVLTAIDLELTEAIGREEAAGVVEGKAPSPSSPTAGG
jgi:hypothetical protein